jgi:hypothetical protein
MEVCSGAGINNSLSHSLCRTMDIFFTVVHACPQSLQLGKEKRSLNTGLSQVNDPTVFKGKQKECAQRRHENKG